MEERTDRSSEIFIDFKLVSSAKIFSEAVSIFTFLTGLIGLFAWKFNTFILINLQSVFGPMSVDTAIGFLFLGSSLWLLQDKRLKKSIRILGLCCVVAVFFLGAVTLAASIIDLNLNIGHFLSKFISETKLALIPVKMPADTAITFIFFSLSILFFDSESKWRKVRLSQILSFLGGVISLVAISNHIHNVEPITSTLMLSGTMSLYTALTFFIFHFGVLLARPESGLTKILVTKSIAGKTARTLLPVAFIAPFIISLLVQYGERVGLYPFVFYADLQTAIGAIIFSAVVIFTSILLEKQEEKIIGSETNFRNIFNYSVDGILLMDLKTMKFVMGNTAICNQLGYTAEEIKNLGLKDIHSKKDLSYVSEQFGRILKGETKTNTNIPVKRRDGTIFYADISANHVVINGKDCVLGIFRDITDRVEAQEKIKQEILTSVNLAKELEKFKLAVDGASDYIIITDMEGKIIYANKAVELVTGYMSAEAVGKDASEIWGGHMSKDFYKKMWHTIKVEKKLFVGEIMNYRKSGDAYTAELRVMPIMDTGGQLQFLVGIERDITKIKEVEKMKDDFISFVSHQLRTPLTIMSWNMEMLKNGDAGKLTREQKRYLTEVEHGAKRMGQLISILLNISRLESQRMKIDPKPVDIIELISSVITEIKSFANAKNCVIKFIKPEKNLPLIYVDAVLLRQVILNLLTNAVYYSKPDRCKIEVAFKEIKGYYQIDVSDHGVGIPHNAKENIFSKFFRADNAIKTDTEGTGLGLYIAKLIVEKSGGKIWFESAEGKGSVFHVTIPTSGMKKLAGEKTLS